MTAPPVFVLRPEPGNAATLAQARALGLEAHGFPLFEVAPVAWQVPDHAAYSGILAGSANVFRHGGMGLSALTGLPVLAVGTATAEAARAAGFVVTCTGEGGLQPLVESLSPGTYLRLAAEEHAELTAPPGVIIDLVVTYAAHAVPLPSELVTALWNPAVVLLHSGEAARYFDQSTVAFDRSRIALACLAPRIAALAGEGWSRVETAVQRTDAALLALALQMCQTV